MEGTQIPIKMAPVASPLKYNISEKMRERNAEININLSVSVKFLSMILNVFMNQVKKGDFLKPENSTCSKG